ncbi:MAG: amidohydrolase family protein [Gammaproteobacteria bacterium]|nr:amidohydrolase family protein [Gammaproteobacteria bacterium]
MKPETVIDADGHICEPELVWTEYTAEKYRDSVLQIRTVNGRSAIAIEGHSRLAGDGPGPAEACIPGGMAPGQSLTWDDILPGGYDPSARLSVLDEEDIDQALFFPSIHLLWGDIRDPEIAAETCRAYNNWMSDFCKVNPHRLFGMGIIPLQDVDLAVAETKRLAKLGLKGLAIRPERFNGLALYDERCDGIWEIAQADNLAVGIHGSFGSRMKGFSSERYEGNVFYDHMIAHPFGQMAVVMDIIAGGVLDRFSNLRVGFFESGLGWIPYWIDRLDEHFEIMGHHTPWLKRRPSEIFKAQCFVSMEADEEKGLGWMKDKDLLDCVLWGSDYPHFDCTYPGAYQSAETTFDAVGEDVAYKVVLENPTRFMALQ